MAVRAIVVLKVGSLGHKHGTTWKPMRNAHSRAWHPWFHKLQSDQEAQRWLRSLALQCSVTE